MCEVNEKEEETPRRRRREIFDDEKCLKHIVSTAARSIGYACDVVINMTPIFN